MKQLKNRNSIEDDDLSVCSLYNETKIINSVDVYLDEGIGPVSYYRNLLHYMRAMEAADELRIWIDTHGGDLDSALAIAQAMNEAEGNVMCIVSGRAHSAGGLIALAAPHLIVQENASFMVHTASYGLFHGKAGNVSSQVDFYTRTIASTIKRYYKYFMNDAEIEDTLNGKDFWFDSEQIIARLEIRAKLQELDSNIKLQEADANPSVVEPKLVRKRKPKVVSN